MSYSDRPETEIIFHTPLCGNCRLGTPTVVPWSWSGAALSTLINPSLACLINLLLLSDIGGRKRAFIQPVPKVASSHLNHSDFCPISVTVVLVPSSV